MFKKLARMPEAYTIKVGNEESFAKYNVHSPYLVQSLLQTISLYPQKEFGELID
jgi:trehalose 6-phosphate synthase/phosphatase